MIRFDSVIWDKGKLMTNNKKKTFWYNHVETKGFYRKLPAFDNGLNEEWGCSVHTILISITWFNLMNI